MNLGDRLVRLPGCEIVGFQVYFPANSSPEPPHTMSQITRRLSPYLLLFLLSGALLAASWTDDQAGLALLPTRVEGVRLSRAIRAQPALAREFRAQTREWQALLGSSIDGEIADRLPFRSVRGKTREVEAFLLRDL